MINIGWPRPEIYGAGAWSRFAALLATLGLIVAGALYFLLFQRKRTGILSEHAAEDILECPSSQPMIRRSKADGSVNSHPVNRELDL